MSEEFDCFARAVPIPQPYSTKFQVYVRFISGLSRARDADKKKHLLSRKFNVPQKMSNEERTLLSSKTEKEKRLTLELHQKKTKKINL